MCGRGYDGIEFETGVWLGAHVGNFAWAVTGYVFGTGHGGFLGNIGVGSKLGDVVGFLVGNFQTDPDSAI